MPTRKGWVQGYNVQVGVTADQLIVATRVSQHTNDSEDFISMMAAVQEAAELFQAAGRDEAVVGVLLADAGYATDTNLSAPGPDRLIALGSRRNQHRAVAHKPTEGPPPEEATPRQAMRHRLRTPEGVATYKRRGATVEPAIGNLKKIISGLSRRGLQAATAESQPGRRGIQPIEDLPDGSDWRLASRPTGAQYRNPARRLDRCLPAHSAPKVIPQQPLHAMYSANIPRSVGCSPLPGVPRRCPGCSADLSLR